MLKKFCVITIILLNSMKFVHLNYCDLEKSNCYGRNHIGCLKGPVQINSKWTEFEVVDMTPKLRALLITSINEYRNNIALGKFSQFPEAADMHYVSWLWEFEHLMEEAVKKTTNFYCVATETFKRPYEVNFKSTGNYTSEEFLQRALKIFMKTNLKSFDDRTWSSFYMSATTNIGCAYATYIDTGKKRHILKCLTNAWAWKTISEAYIHGEPCSKCIKTKCLTFFAGLCSKQIVGPPGVRGLQGVQGGIKANEEKIKKSSCSL